MSLREIDSKRVEGKFVDAEGNKVRSYVFLLRTELTSPGTRSIRPPLPLASLPRSPLPSDVGIRAYFGRAHAYRMSLLASPIKESTDQ
jgi:hypothetical protein